MRANIEEYKAVENAAMKFVKSVAEGNSSYAKDLFVDEAVLFGYLDGKLEHGSIEQFYHNVDTVSAGNNFKARIDIVSVEETVAVVRVLEEKWGDRIDFTDYLLLLKINNEWKCVAKAYLAWLFCLSTSLPSAAVAAFGTAAGELFSCLFLMACLSVSHSRSPQKHRPISVFFKEKTLWYDTFRELAVLNLPLTLNRILLNILHSIGSALLPGCLVTSGLSRKTALSQYGILTGMALPMIFFPSAITHAVSVMLLPGVAKQQADGTPEQISDTIRYTISFCVLLGTSAVFAFFFFGPWLGRFLFQNEEVGVFLRILSFLSPFLYLETTLGSILNGLGKTSLVFFQNLAGDVIRILAILFLVPVFGIRGYLYGILASELTIMTMALLFLHRESANGFAVH